MTSEKFLGDKSSHAQELRYKSLEKPYKIDVKELQSQYFPEGKHLKASNGDEYILDSSGKTIILFRDKTEAGFTSIYSPLAASELKNRLMVLSEVQREELFSFLGLKEIEANFQPVVGRQISSERSSFSFIRPRINKGEVIEEESVVSSEREDRDLPEDHFIELSLTEYQDKRRQQWEEVKNLDDNDPQKIIYFRRFTNEFRSPVRFNPQLTEASSNPYRYYEVDTSRMPELKIVEPYKITIQVPEGKKVAFIIGYHHLEKSWGHLFREMFQKQVQYDPSQIEFISIQNKDIPTGDKSRASELEIRNHVRDRGITHVIDVHEQLAALNHYMDVQLATNRFREASKSQAEGEFTLDPFVPTWMIEQYYRGNIYPQLQYAVNEQIKKVAELIKSIK